MWSVDGYITAVNTTLCPQCLTATSLSIDNLQYFHCIIEDIQSKEPNAIKKYLMCKLKWLIGQLFAVLCFLKRKFNHTGTQKKGAIGLVFNNKLYDRTIVIDFLCCPNCQEVCEKYTSKLSVA